MDNLHIILITVMISARVAVSLRCYSCSFSFNELYDMEHRDAWCANESLVMYEIDETSKECAPWEAFCVTAVMTINNAFTSVSRGCGERCSELCESEGYGQDQVNCDDCCEDDLCNSNFSVQYYITMMESQYTSWSKPLSGEGCSEKIFEKRKMRIPDSKTIKGVSVRENKTFCKIGTIGATFDFPTDLLGLIGVSKGVDVTNVELSSALLALYQIVLHYGLL